MDLLIIFLTGLTTGGLTCVAMQGGLLTSVIANQKRGESATPPNSTLLKLDTMDWLPVIVFLIAKLLSHVLLGFMLGWVGSFITLDLSVRLLFQTFAALFMLATAMNLLQVHPVFRFLAFQPPKFIARYIRKTSKSKALFAPALLGLLTIFIPCGVTQAVEVLAINSGSPVQAALIMGAFVLGTSPLFAIVGVLTSRLTVHLQQHFLRFAALVLILMSLYGLNGVLVVLDSPLTAQKVFSPITYFFSDDRFGESTAVAANPDGVQKVTINIQNDGYAPDNFSVKAGVPVELTLQTRDVYSCAATFVFRQFNINTFLKPTETQTFTITPKEKGTYTFACSMGMYTGTMRVI